MKMASSSVAAVLLVSAGVFQFSSAKSACLKHCRTPVGFLLSEWRAGMGGALVMGVRHGLYCVGCCWLLMLLLFVAGVMNAAWCAALAALVLAERVLPGGLWLARAVGVVLALSGGGLAAGIW
jgi:predicted metal-binding membrane protein